MADQRQTQDGFSGLEQLFVDSEDWSPAGDTPERRRRRSRRRWRTALITVLVAVVILGAVGGYAGWALNAPIDPPVVAAHAPAIPAAAAAAVVLPTEGSSALEITGAGGSLVTGTTTRTLTSGSAGSRPMASISKLITALVILQAHPLTSTTDPGPTITFGPAAHALYDKYYVMGASIAPMPTGTRMSLHDALTAMLLPSAANYAEALATWAFGSQSAFVSAARNWLAAHGMHHTAIYEPTGMDPHNTSTPADMLILGKIAAANPAISAITGTSTATVPGAGTLYNTNDLLGTDGISGLKTGNLTAGTYNLLYTASLDVGLSNPLTVTGIMMGGRSHDSVNDDVTAELNSIMAGFHTLTLARAGQDVGTYTTPWGSHAQMAMSDGATITTWSNTPVSVSMTTTAPAHYRDGAVVGRVTWKAGAQTVQADLVVRGNITPPTALWRLTHPWELGLHAGSTPPTP